MLKLKEEVVAVTVYMQYFIVDEAKPDYKPLKDKKGPPSLHDGASSMGSSMQFGGGED